MKRIIITLALLFLINHTEAQKNTMCDRYTSVGGSIVNIASSFFMGRHFGVYHHAEEGVFSVTDFTQYYTSSISLPFTNTMRFRVAQDYVVSDVVSFGNIIFFCGKKMTGSNPLTSIGFIGWITNTTLTSVAIPAQCEYFESYPGCVSN